MPPPFTSGLRCDVFCQVIDNFGDAGVCWRLASQLAAVTPWEIRLIIDQALLIDRLQPHRESWPDRVSVLPWDSPQLGDESADVVIEAFGCRPPDQYQDQIRRRRPAPAWVNLEYLSAETWIDDCHGLPSPDPHSGIAKYFFFPGFSARSGGLIYEPWLDELLAGMAQTGRRQTWLKSIGVETSSDECLISLFCYGDSPFEDLFKRWQGSEKNVHCLLAAGLPAERLKKIFTDAILAGLRITQLPFLDQNSYDRLLAACDINFVRGEDSFVRAQWAGKPFVWQAYRQAENVHHEKLAAFLDRYLLGMSAAAAAAVRSLHDGWNGVEVGALDRWADFLRCAPEIAIHNAKWRRQLASHGNLAENLAVFCQSKL